MATHPRTRLVAFDLDDTLAPSKTPLAPEMATALRALLERHEVLVISGGNLAQFRSQLLAPLGTGGRLSALHLMPTCGTRYLRLVDGEWAEVYAHELSVEDRARATETLESVARSLGLWEADDVVSGDRIEDRGTQVTFSALGQQAAPERKKVWDPDGRRREALRRGVAALLPGLEVRSGGSTSVDVTARGIDKAFGLARIMELLSLRPDEVLFVGDRLDPGGNDHPVIALGVRTRPVRDEHETLGVIDALLAAPSSSDEAPREPAALSQ